MVRPVAAAVAVIVAIAVLTAPSAAARPAGSGYDLAADGVKWHPGHYVLLDGILRNDDKRAGLMAAHRQHIAELGNLDPNKTVKGVKIIIQWSAAEGATAGDYTAGVALVQQYLDWVSAVGRRLWVAFSHTQFGGFPPSNLQLFFPNYIVTGSQYGTTRLDNSRGIMARIWQTATMDRIIAKSRFYANTFNGHPSMEGISIGETSIGITPGIDGFSEDAVLTQFKRFYSAARTHWPNTALRLTANFMSGDSRMINLIAHCRLVYCAVGGPDTIPSEDIQANRIFTGETGGVDYRGVIPFVSEVQSPSLCGHEGCWTPRQLYDHAMLGNPALGIRAVQPQYFVWYRNTWSGGPPQQWYTGILPFIKEIQGRVFTTACPTAYPSCITT